MSDSKAYPINVPRVWVKFQIGDWVRHKLTGLIGQLHHWCEGGASVQMANRQVYMQYGGQAIHVSHVVLKDNELDQWEKVAKPE
jgi:hypothetical protein